MNPSSIIDRPRLLSELARTETPVIGIVAGAGYGKTTLVRQWEAAEDRPFAWLDLQRGDNDPVILMRQLLESLRAVMGLDDVVHAAREPQPRFADRVLPLLLDALHRFGEPFVVVIDDLELLGVEAAELLDDVLDHIAQHAQCVLIGRTLPVGLRTARRRIEGSLRELGSEDLAFTVDEAEALFEATGTQVNPSSVSGLVALTLGWPIGLHLAASGARRGTVPASAWEALGGERRLLRSYINEEILGDLEPADRSFLLESAVLEWLDPELCDRVLDSPDSALHLQQLMADGRILFVRSDDRRGIRYHPVLREVLIDRLRATDPERELELRHRAISAYEWRNDHRTAIDAALASGDARLAEEVLFRHLPTVIFSGEYVSLSRWLSRLADQDQRRRSGLRALAEAWLALVTNRRGDLEGWLAVADATGHEGPMPDGSASFELAASVVRMLGGVGGTSATVDYARQVRAAGPLGSPWWGIAGGIEAIASHFAGLTPDLREALQSAEFEARGIHASHATSCAHLGYAELQRGNTEVGLALVRDAVDEVTQASLVDFPLTAMVFVVSAYAYAVRGNLARSRSTADHARVLLKGISDVVDRGYIHAHLILGDAARKCGDFEQAREDLRAAQERLPVEPDAVVLHEWADLLELKLSRTVTRSTAPEITAAELRVLEQLPTHRSLAEIGRELYVSRNTVKSHTMSIYRKLGVASRSDAVRMAKDLDLL